MTESAGMVGRLISWEASWGDLNNDRFRDLATYCHDYRLPEVYRNNGDGAFTDMVESNPEVKVGVQVSVNPPQKREITPDEVIQHVELIADKADLIWIYFAPRRASVMEEVFRRLRQ